MAQGAMDDRPISTPTVHASRERLVYLSKGLLGALERSRLEGHLSQCIRCSAELDRVRTLSTGILRRSEPARGRVMGRLRFDSATMPPGFGTRGSTDGNDRQLVFQAGSFEVELHTRQHRAGWSIRGKVLGPTDATAGEVRLIDHRTRARSALSERLEFRLPVVPRGAYRLELRLDSDAVLQIDFLPLG